MTVAGRAKLTLVNVSDSRRLDTLRTGASVAAVLLAAWASFGLAFMISMWVWALTHRELLSSDDRASLWTIFALASVALAVTFLGAPVLVVRRRPAWLAGLVGLSVPIVLAWTLVYMDVFIVSIGKDLAVSLANGLTWAAPAVGLATWGVLRLRARTSP